MDYIRQIEKLSVLEFEKISGFSWWYLEKIPEKLLVLVRENNRLGRIFEALMNKFDKIWLYYYF